MKKLYVMLFMVGFMFLNGEMQTVSAQDVYIGTDTYMGSNWFIRTENTYSTTGNSVNCTLIDNTARGGSIMYNYVIFRSHRDMKYYYYEGDSSRYYPVDISSGTLFAVKWLKNNGGF